MSLGLDQIKGTGLGADAHIYQSLKRLLTTPVGSRVMRRDYGCALPDLIGQPNNPLTWMLAQAAIAEAILEHENKRIELRSVRVFDIAQGQFKIALTAISRLTGKDIVFEELL